MSVSFIVVLQFLSMLRFGTCNFFILFFFIFWGLTFLFVFVLIHIDCYPVCHFLNGLRCYKDRFTDIFLVYFFSYPCFYSSCWSLTRQWGKHHPWFDTLRIDLRPFFVPGFCVLLSDSIRRRKTVNKSHNVWFLVSEWDTWAFLIYFIGRLTRFWFRPGRGLQWARGTSWSGRRNPEML